MKLEDYTTEQLKSELKRRAEVARKEKMSVSRCRNCKHLLIREKNWYTFYECSIRTYSMKGHEYNYSVKLSQKACDKYERKENKL